MKFGIGSFAYRWSVGRPYYRPENPMTVDQLIDRCVARWRTIKNKTFYYIMTSAEDSDTVMDTTLQCLRGLALCLDGSVEGGVIYGKGVYEAGAIAGRPVMQEAYEMGRRV